MSNVSDLSRLFKLYNQETGKDEPVVLTEGQKKIFEIIVRRTPRYNHVISTTQYGKKLGDETPILTSDGWKKHGDLQIGDKVFSPDGKLVEVLDILNEGVDVDYEIEFTNNEKITCHGQHEWLVSHADWSKSSKPYRILETQEIEKLNYKRCSLPNIKPLEYPEKELPVDPYTLGAWLGDGVSIAPAITISPDDDAIIKKIPYKVSSENEHKDTGIHRYYFGHQELNDKLIKLGVHKNKHIPEIYKTSSVNQRLELLAGLIDTDGHVNKDVRENGWKNGRVYFININKRLIDDFVEVVHSLGMRTSITSVEPHLSTSGIQARSTVYYVGFQPMLDIPTAIDRKKIVAHETKRRTRIRNIKRIEPISGKCITVEGGMYLAGKTLIPTHNSEVVSMAVLIRAVNFGEKWAVVAPSMSKAQIIMGNIRKHIFDNEIFKDQLEMDAKEKDRLKREVSKSRLTFKGGGEIFVLSADNKNKSAAGESLMGFGSANIIIDESSLIDDDIYSKILRMLGGHKDHFLFEIGNPFHRNHFYKTSLDESYNRLVIDYKQAIREGRLQPEFVEKMRKQFDFGVMYECKFPDAGEIDSDGWVMMFTENDIVNSYRSEDVPSYGTPRLGIDVSRAGGNFNVFILRTGNYAKVLSKNTTENLMEIVGMGRDLADKYGVDESNIYLDATGLGAGIYDRFLELGWNVTGVNLAEKALNQEKYINIRAEAYFELLNWIKGGGMLKRDSDFLQLCDIRYKMRDNGKLKIIDKEALRKRNIASPDVADALMLTFTRPDDTPMIFKQKQNEANRQKQPNYY